MPTRKNRSVIKLITDNDSFTIGIIFGLLAVLAGAKPTGFLVADALYVISAVVVVVVIGSRAPWWIIALQVSVAAAIAFSLPGLAFGATLYLVSLFLSSTKSSSKLIKAAVVGCSINLMFYSHWTSVFGISSFIGLASNGLFCLIALKSCSVKINVTRKKFFVVSSILVVSLFGLLFALLMAREPLTSGNRLAREGIAALNQGDLTTARQRLDGAQKELESASSWLNSPLTVMARVIPFVSQHRDAVAGMSSSFSRSLRQLSSGLSQFDLEKIRVVQGKIDLVAINDLRSPLAQMMEVLKGLRGKLIEVQSPWLIGKVQDKLSGLLADLDQQLARGANAQVALELAPRLLGSEHPVTYFVALTTPVEARGQGGFMGNWLELIVDKGRIEVGKYGRATDLNAAGDRPRKITGAADWLQRYGDFGFTNGTGGGIDEHAWQNITMSPHFPSTGEVISELYPQSGGTKLDGVFAMDVKTISALLEFAGPVAVEGTDQILTAGNAEEFLLHDQYVDFATGERIDLLDSVTHQALHQILEGKLPPPNVVANRLGPMVAQGRLLGYSPDPDIEDLFSRIGMSGSLTCEKTVDCFAVTVDNASGNKIDYYLDMAVDYSVELKQNSHEVKGKVTITASNSAPTSGLPDYIIGNLVGLPRGYNRTLISIHSRLGYVRSVDPNSEVRWWFTSEQGHNVSSAYIDIPPGKTVQITVELGGSLDLTHGYSLTARNVAAVRPWATTIELVKNGKTQILKNSAEAGTWVLASVG